MQVAGRGRTGGLSLATVVVCLCVCALRPATASQLNPIEKTVELLTQLQSKVVASGERAQAAYQKYLNWCDDASKEKQFEVKKSTKEKTKLEADLQLAASDIEASTAKIDELSSLISSNEEKLKEITAVRKEEVDVFKASEKQLMEAIDMLGRSIEILEKEMQGGSAALLQTTVDTQSLEDVLLGLGAIIDAAGLPASDTQKLVSLLERRADAADSDEDMGAPAPDAYKSQSGSVVEVMEDMREKAELQLRNVRAAESNAQINYDLLRLSLKQQTDNADKEMKDEKADKAAAEEAKATAEGDLAVATKALKDSQQSLANTQSTCIRTAADHEASLAGRKEELEVLAKAKKTIQSTMTGNAASFLQMKATSATSRKRQHLGSVSKQVVALVRQLASRQKSPSLTQLASRLAAVVRYGAGSGEDPFVKVKGLVQDMIQKLENEANAEAKEKEYCDNEMKKTDSQQDELQDAVEGLKGKIDQAASSSATLKGRVKEFQAELADLAKQQAALDDARSSSHAAYEESKADLQQGLDGVRRAIRILREYYASDDEGDGAALLQSGSGSESETESESSDSMEEEMAQAQPAPPQKHEESKGAGDSIVGLLEVVESDLAKNLAEEETEETGAVMEYEKVSQENKVLKTMKEKDVEYKTREYKGLDKAITDLSSDYDSTTEELDAVREYFAKVKERCVAKPEAYAERMKRRDAEIKGLQEALAVLQGEGASSFLQKRRR